MQASTKKSLIDDLRRLGIRDGDVVMVHASLSTVGPVDGGPMTVALALREAVGAAGTLAAYVSWEYSPYEATLGGRRLPRKEERAWPRFEPDSPPYHGFGTLNTFLLRLDGTHRSPHPDASIFAVGALASEITALHPLGTGYGPGSPIERLIARGCKVLLLGAPLDSVTVLHYAEAVARIPGKRIITYRAPQPGGSSPPDWVDVAEFDSNGILDVFAGEATMDAVESIARAYLLEGRHTQGIVGRACSIVFDAKDIVDFGVGYLEERFT
ncbi:aminoglycoside 3-N-acetyltransferase [Ensifer sp. HO-A22]|uniref:Aminoglycoside N(3)-acetyltransferase n=1 Tax=Ensifer oleiphilus TaxID=2742698 RepID=A0A7Y6QAB8_9HYPH|nr:aminoglycoside 3-N-acetyltransferase [Ensifer oleiphilus]NVD41947.1 aminoglycoside 3-N-acetyltransferase [Ensifer oleiphilus]